MEFKAYYYTDNNKCVICEKKDEQPDFNSINNKSIIIDINSKNVENIYDFFRNNILKSILSGDGEIMIDYSEIENKDFYDENSFKKLIELIKKLTNQANESITECLSNDGIDE